MRILFYAFGDCSTEWYIFDDGELDGVPLQMGWPEQPDRDRIWVDKKKTVTFIVAAINSTAESKSKKLSMQYIVRAAVDHLGMAALKWEEVEAGQSSQEPERCSTHYYNGNYSMECQKHDCKWAGIQAVH